MGENDFLLMNERISQSLILGESQFREFKSAFVGRPNEKKPRQPKDVAKDIAETLVAFANADGGELLVGVEDDGTPTGISYSEDTISKLLQAPVTGVLKETPLDNPISQQISKDGLDLLYFRIEKGTRIVHQTTDGKTLVRRDRENRPVPTFQLQFERQEQLSREYDRAFVDGAIVTDLDLDTVLNVASQISCMSAEKCLQYLGLAEYGKGNLQLRKACLLLFSKNVNRWHPRCQVRIIRIKGTEMKVRHEYNVISDEYADGNILELISSSWEKLRPHLVETKMMPDALFKENVMYPEEACREALINAIAHRDYSIEGQNIEILIYDDRMEVRSPGNLLSTIRIDELRKLQGFHESRNALITRTLREIGYMREMGEGMRRIFRSMQDADLIPPEIQSDQSNFSIILHHKSVFSDSDQQWLLGYKPLKLTKQEMLIALMGKQGNLLSPQQIYDRLNLVDWDIYREIINQIKTKGILYDAKTKNQVTTKSRRRFSIRLIPKLAVRAPLELEQGLSELSEKLKRMDHVKILDYNFSSQLLSLLSPANPYKASKVSIFQLLKILGLINENKEPTLLLFNLWGISDEEIQKLKTTKTKGVTNASKSKFFGNKNQVSVKDLFVGNLEYGLTREDLHQLFSKYGEVRSIIIPVDMISKRSRGFSFIRMSSEIENEKIIQELNGSVFHGRELRINRR